MTTISNEKKKKKKRKERREEEQERREKREGGSRVHERTNFDPTCNMHARARAESDVQSRETADSPEPNAGIFDFCGHAKNF